MFILSVLLKTQDLIRFFFNLKRGHLRITFHTHRVIMTTFFEPSPTLVFQSFLNIIFKMLKSNKILIYDLLF